MDTATATDTAAVDLCNKDFRDQFPHTKRLLQVAASLIALIDTPDMVGRPDERLRDAVSDQCWTVQPPNTFATEDKPHAFPTLLAAYGATRLATAKSPGNTHRAELRDMSQEQRRALKLALHADVTRIIAAARRDATDATPKLFDGAHLTSTSTSTSTSTADVRKALNALLQDAYDARTMHAADGRITRSLVIEKKKRAATTAAAHNNDDNDDKALKRRIEYLNDALDTLDQLDEGLLAAETFARDERLLACMAPGAPLPPQTFMEKKRGRGGGGGDDNTNTNTTKRAKHHHHH
jgi:hypothetical protein